MTALADAATMDEARLAEAVAEWRRHLGPEQVLDDPATRQRLTRNTLTVDRTTALVLRPEHAESVPGILAIASRHQVPLYSISTGRNWGYGCAAPVGDQQVILDLSRLRSIELVDAEMGIVTVQPGVTQGDLARFLEERDLAFLVPVTGAGPDASILGNAVERGYGLTPFSDHFSAVMAMRVALADGSIYRPALSEAGAGLADSCFKWGAGPYLDGIFTQSNLGVVLDMTVALARRPERTLPFIFTVERDEDLEAAVETVRTLLAELGSTLSGVNLINRRRMLSMVEPYPFDRVAAGGVIPDELVDSLARPHRIGAWTGVGTLYGTAAVVAAARRRIRKRLRPLVQRLVFLHPRVISVASRVAKLPGFRGNFARMTKKLQEAIENFSGRPSDVALPLAYWRSREGRPPGKLDPSKDGCGLIWYSPLVPMRPALVRDYVRMCEGVCRKHGMEPAITLTSCSERCYDSTLPLLFQRDSEDERQRALACHDELVEAGRKLGLLPYRYGIHAMDRIIDADAVYWRVGAAIKAALDPQHVLAPGRYCLPRERCTPLQDDR